MGFPFLKAASQSYEAVCELLEATVAELKVAMHLRDSRRPAQLHRHFQFGHRLRVVGGDGGRTESGDAIERGGGYRADARGGCGGDRGDAQLAGAARL